jgi:hypothetical protein
MDCLLQTGTDAAHSTVMQQLHADLARYQYESAQIEQASQALINCQALTDEQVRLLHEWLDYAGYLMNPQPAAQDARPF